MEWMRGFWRSDPCYASFGVDGSPCSFRIYLSEIEAHCPPLPWRPLPKPAAAAPKAARPARALDGLLARMADNAANFAWISRRLRRLWPAWLAGLDSLRADWLLHRTPRRILLHLGSLTKGTPLPPCLWLLDEMGSQL